MDNYGKDPYQFEELSCFLTIKDVNDEKPEFSAENPEVFCCILYCACNQQDLKFKTLITLNLKIFISSI
jgi:hypothetical protein